MPEYSYKCRVCEHEFSVKKPISDARNDEACPVCGGETGKIWSAPALGGTCQSSGATGGG